MYICKYACLHVCMLMLSVLSMTHLAISLNSVDKKLIIRCSPSTWNSTLGNQKHAISDNREGLGPYKIK